MNSWGQAAYVAAGKQVHVNIDPAGVASDVCNAARAMMFALGCIQALKCNTNDCPTGITTQNKKLMQV